MVIEYKEYDDLTYVEAVMKIQQIMAQGSQLSKNWDRISYLKEVMDRKSTLSPEDIEKIKEAVIENLSLFYDRSDERVIGYIKELKNDVIEFIRNYNG